MNIWLPINKQKQVLDEKRKQAEEHLDLLRTQLGQQTLIVEDMVGTRVNSVSHILDIWYPNDMNALEKLTQWSKQVWAFLSENPRI